PRKLVNRTTLPDGTELTPGQYGPDVDATWPLGTFIEDYEFAPDPGDLDEHNGRFGATPEFPQGTYAYFLDTTYPYLVGPTYYGKIAPAELRDAAHATKPAPTGPIELISSVVNAASLAPSFAPASLATATGRHFSTTTGSA